MAPPSFVQVSDDVSIAGGAACHMVRVCIYLSPLDSSQHHKQAVNP